MSPAAAAEKPMLQSFVLRLWAVVAILLVGAGLLMARAIQLQVFDTTFLNKQAASRHIRVATVSAIRGVIKDRNGEPLAVSTPVDSVWVIPHQVLKSPDQISELSRALQIDQTELNTRLSRNIKKSSTT